MWYLVCGVIFARCPIKISRATRVHVFSIIWNSVLKGTSWLNSRSSLIFDEHRFSFPFSSKFWINSFKQIRIEFKINRINSKLFPSNSLVSLNIFPFLFSSPPNEFPSPKVTKLFPRPNSAKQFKTSDHETEIRRENARGLKSQCGTLIQNNTSLANATIPRNINHNWKSMCPPMSLSLSF